MLKNKAPLLDAIKQELIQRSSYLSNEVVNTIYFGGGTPSILAGEEIHEILNTVYEKHPVALDAEITLEANPDDLNLEKLQRYYSYGINRLSIGIQSFHEQDIRFLNRAHNALQAKESILAAQAAGFSNITIDLIYGIPGQEDKDWIKNLEQCALLQLPHFSAYSLTVEEKTALAHMINKGTVKQTSDETAAMHFEILQQWCIANGYDAYEISNYARPGWYSRHNSAYWNHEKYLGVGPSAHSYDGISRQWNIANNSIYINKVSANEPYWEWEDINTTTRYNEYIMTSLRTATGADLDFIKKLLPDNYWGTFMRLVDKYSSKGQLLLEGNKIKLSLDARFLSDGIIADFFITSEND